jgi:hypothetical protein
MLTARRFAVAVLILAAVPWTAQAGVAVGIGVGFGGPYYRHCYPYRVGVGFYYAPGPYYYGAPVYVAPAPVVVAPTPVVAAPVAVAGAAPAPTVTAASPEPPLAMPKDVTLPPPAPVPPAAAPAIDDLIRQLNSADDRARADAAVQLGRLHASRGVGPLIRLLREDRSASVREAAARGLGLIGETNSLAALQQAAQADDDHDVRRSASFAADVIRSRLR